LRKTFHFGAWYAAGIVCGGALYAWASAYHMIKLESTTKVVELAQLAATIFLALYIPLALETYRDRRKYAQEMLIDHIRSFVSGLESVNAYLRENANASPPADLNSMRVRTGFITANLKMARLQERLPIECGEGCRQYVDDLRTAYDRYYEAVTDGSLYGDGLVTWKLWKRQEFAFTSLQNAELDLIRFVNDHGLR
jgi:hypothetical protein